MFEIYSTMIMKLLNNSLLYCAIVVGALLATPLEEPPQPGPISGGFRDADDDLPS